MTRQNSHALEIVLLGYALVQNALTDMAEAPSLGPCTCDVKRIGEYRNCPACTRDRLADDAQGQLYTIEIFTSCMESESYGLPPIASQLWKYLDTTVAEWAPTEAVAEALLRLAGQEPPQEEADEPIVTASVSGSTARFR